jgi:hypothetical protein
MLLPLLNAGILPIEICKKLANPTSAQRADKTSLLAIDVSEVPTKAWKENTSPRAAPRAGCP